MLESVVEHAPPAVAKPEQLITVAADPLAHDRADNSVEAGAVTAAREDTDAHLGESYVAGLTL
jgi:hypothetical protein